MNNTTAIMKASFIQLRIYFLIVTGFIAASITADVIVKLSVSGEDSTQVSVANLFLVILPFVASILPSVFFKRIINLGSSRAQYYSGLLAIYASCAAAFSIINVLWRMLENGPFHGIVKPLNILEIFHWTQFGVVGMLVYQFGAYMLLMSLLNLLFSGLWHWIGWLILAVLIAAIPIGTSIQSFRPYVADGFLKLLFNDSLLQGFGLTFILSCVFLTIGWLFTRRRPF